MSHRAPPARPPGPMLCGLQQVQQAEVVCSLALTARHTSVQRTTDNVKQTTWHRADGIRPCVRYVSSGSAYLRGCPLSVSVVPGRAIGAHCTVHGSAVCAAEVEALSSFTVQCYDRHRNLTDTDDSEIIVRAIGSLSSFKARANRVGEGTYRVMYTAGVSGTFQLHVGVLGSAVQGSPFALKVSPGATCKAPLRFPSPVPVPFQVPPLGAFGHIECA